MAINKNHEFEELDGIKCGIVEKNASAGRAAFLKGILEYNRYQVVVVPSPAPKAAAKPAVTEPPQPVIAAGPETFTVGVTDYTFNPINAIFGRLLKARDNQVITLAYWNQEDATNHGDIPYYDRQA